MMYKSERVSESPLAVVFSNIDYLQVLENWLAAIKKIHVENYLVVSLDEELHQQLQSREIPSLLRPCVNNLKELWVHRMRVLLELLNENSVIIHSDADAVWIKNPVSYLQEIDSELIFSQGTVWPLDVHEQWKFVLCCGFFLVRRSAASLSFFNEVFEQVKIEKDDQLSINRLLLKKGIAWEEAKRPYTLRYNQHDFVCSDAIRCGRIGNLSVALLPHSGFQRLFQKAETIYVRHILSPKNSDSILETLEKYDCKFV